MFTFAAGPSQIHPLVPSLYARAFQENVGSISHRSQAFMDAHALTVRELKRVLNIPAGYHLAFATSATECWEIITQNLCPVGEGTSHLYSGSFGQKWYEYSRFLRPGATSIKVDIDADSGEATAQIPPGAPVVCLTHNETSNATALPKHVLELVRGQNSDSIIAIDGTSSMGGVRYDWAQADVWFCSVQKCFGMPAGLGILVYNDKALTRAENVGQNGYYNSLTAIHANALKNQNVCTPNVLAIWALGQLLTTWNGIDDIENTLSHRKTAYEKWVESKPDLKLLVQNPANRSTTITAAQADPAVIAQYKKAAKAKGFELGGGYGPWKETTFRIANFPAISDEQHEALLSL